MAKDIHQTVTFDATPADIYKALIDPKLHAAFTGSPAKNDGKVGSSFSAHGNYISGVNVELVKGARIVQAWRGANWPTGAWSVVRFELSPAGTGQTKLVFSQHGVPDDHHKAISQGWKDRYWTPLAKWLDGRGAKRTPAKAKKKKAARK